MGKTGLGMYCTLAYDTPLVLTYYSRVVCMVWKSPALANCVCSSAGAPIDLPAGTSSDDNISRITCCLSELVIISTVEARSLCEVLVVV